MTVDEVLEILQWCQSDLRVVVEDDDLGKHDIADVIRCYDRRRPDEMIVAIKVKE